MATLMFIVSGGIALIAGIALLCHFDKSDPADWPETQPELERPRNPRRW